MFIQLLDNYYHYKYIIPWLVTYFKKRSSLERLRHQIKDFPLWKSAIEISRGSNISCITNRNQQYIMVCI